ncbi:hypothetical protein O9992_19790 [Vibrio lentus]|nr:hypothetical protein [Vibrio lentus]
MAKDATETTEENAWYRNGNVPAATDVDGTVESYQLVDDDRRQLLDVQRCMAATRSLQAATSMTRQGQDRDVTFTYTATDNDTGVSEPKTITITVTAATTRQWQKTRLKRPKKTRY